MNDLGNKNKSLLGYNNNMTSESGKLLVTWGEPENNASV